MTATQVCGYAIVERDRRPTMFLVDIAGDAPHWSRDIDRAKLFFALADAAGFIEQHHLVGLAGVVPLGRWHGIQLKIAV